MFGGRFEGEHEASIYSDKARLIVLARLFSFKKRLPLTCTDNAHPIISKVLSEKKVGLQEQGELQRRVIT